MTAAHNPGEFPYKKTWIFTAILVGATLAAWWPVTDLGFVDYDDRHYVTENPAIQGGVTATSLRWALTTFHAANWHPLTWVTHIIDWSLYGADPLGPHVTNLVLHLLNTLLLFFLLARSTGSTGRSFFVAALFSLHPLHVESVAWIAERKDVLHTFFWLLALLAWVRWTRTRAALDYAGVMLAMAASLASKPMAVTLPFTLMAFDVWPLGRAEGGLRRWRGLLVEKLPLFGLSIVVSVITLMAQSSGGAVRDLGDYSIPVRLANAAVSYVAYLGKAIYPVGLAVIYPHPGSSIEAWKVIGAIAILTGITWFAWRARHTAGYFIAGWFWFVITLVPVSGVLQAGDHAMTDRFTYVPLIGIFVAVAWGVSDRIGGGLPSRGAFRLPAIAAAIVLILMGLATRRQIPHWRDGVTLFTHALEVTSHNWIAHTNLGFSLATRERVVEAAAHYEAALAIKPDDIGTLVNLANAQTRLGRNEAAYSSYRRAITLDSRNALAHYNFGTLLERLGREDEAATAYRAALAIDPGDERVHYNLGTVLAQQGLLDEAIHHLGAATRLRPDYGRAHANLAGALLLADRPTEAWEAAAAARRHGFEPPAELLDALRERMPEPKR